MITITKVSGVVSILDSSNTNPKSYFGATGKFQASDDDLTVFLKVGSAGQIQPDEYTLSLGSVSVGGSTPSTISDLKILINSIFGS